MDPATLSVIGVLGAAVFTALGGVYGSRSNARATQQGSVIGGYDSLTARLTAERDKAERDEATADARAAAAEARAHALEADNARLRALVTQLGGTP